VQARASIHMPLLTHSPGARRHYDHRRECGDTYSAARNLANRTSAPGT
jgi:hypothetical protein